MPKTLSGGEESVMAYDPSGVKWLEESNPSQLNEHGRTLDHCRWNAQNAAAQQVQRPTHQPPRRRVKLRTSYEPIFTAVMATSHLPSLWGTWRGDYHRPPPTRCRVVPCRGSSPALWMPSPAPHCKRWAQYHTIPYHTIPYHTIPYHTIPYHTIPYHTIPYHTIPYHTILYYTIQ